MKSYKNRVIVLINYNNFQWFIDIKNPSFCQVWWAEKLFNYYFQIYYAQDKVNTPVNAIFCFS